MNAKRRQDCRYVWPTCEASAYARYDLSRCRTHHRGFSLRALPETLVSDIKMLSGCYQQFTTLQTNHLAGGQLKIVSTRPIILLERMLTVISKYYTLRSHKTIITI